MKTARLLVAFLVLIGGSFSAFAADTCAGQYVGMTEALNGAYAYRSSNPSEVYQPAQCLSWPGQCGSQPNVCTLQKIAGGWVFFGYGAGCPAGTTADANGECKDNSGPSPGRQAAEDAARAAAAASGYDEAAQDAAAAAAGESYDEWIAAGKSAEDAAKAAAASGVVGAVENMQGRMASAYAAAAAAASACLAAGNSGCASHYQQADELAASMGWDVTNPPALCFGPGCTGTGASDLYIAKETGGWSVISDPGNGTGLTFGGHVSGFPTGPNQQESNAFGASQPSSSQIVQSNPTNAGGKKIIQTADGGGALVVVRDDGVTEVYYFDSQTHEQDAKATVNSNGSTVCVGDCTGKQPINDVVAAGSGSRAPSSGGSSGGGLSPGDSNNLRRIADAVGGTGSLDGMNTEKGAFESAIDLYKQTIDKIGTDPAPDTGWNWFPQFPSAQCEPWRIPRGNGAFVEIDPCPAAARIRELGGYLLYFVTMFGLFNILTGKKESA